MSSSSGSSPVDEYLKAVFFYYSLGTPESSVSISSFMDLCVDAGLVRNELNHARLMSIFLTYSSEDSNSLQLDQFRLCISELCATASISFAFLADKLLGKEGLSKKRLNFFVHNVPLLTYAYSENPTQGKFIQELFAFLVKRVSGLNLDSISVVFEECGLIPKVFLKSEMMEISTRVLMPIQAPLDFPSFVELFVLSILRSPPCLLYEDTSMSQVFDRLNETSKLACFFMTSNENRQNIAHTNALEDFTCLFLQKLDSILRPSPPIPQPLHEFLSENLCGNSLGNGVVVSLPPRKCSSISPIEEQNIDNDLGSCSPEAKPILELLELPVPCPSECLSSTWESVAALRRECEYDRSLLVLLSSREEILREALQKKQELTTNTSSGIKNDNPPSVSPIELAGNKQSEDGQVLDEDDQIANKVESLLATFYSSTFIDLVDRNFCLEISSILLSKVLDFDALRCLSRMCEFILEDVNIILKCLWFNLLGKILFNMERYDYAIRSYLHARDFVEDEETEGGNHHSDIEDAEDKNILLAVSYYNCGVCFVELDRGEEARIFFLYSKRLMENLMTPEDPLLFSCMKAVQLTTQMMHTFSGSYKIPPTWMVLDSNQMGLASGHEKVSKKKKKKGGEKQIKKKKKSKAKK